MNNSRRKFLQQSGLMLAATALYSNSIWANKKAASHIVGIQLYTVRDDMKSDPHGTLKKLKDMGYTHVEHAGYEDGKFYGESPADFKKYLDSVGLIMLSGHSFFGAEQWNSSTNDLSDVYKKTVEDAASVGMKYVISPGVDESLSKTESDFKHYMEMYNKAGELCKQHGLTFAYHNESYEFDHSLNNVRLYDIILSSTDPKLVAQQIDIGNMYGTGGRAMEYLKKYKGRFFSMHVKDEIKSNTHAEGWESTVLGKGVIGVKSIVDYALKNGTQQFIIEQEAYQDKTPLDCSKEDLMMMKQWGF